MRKLCSRTLSAFDALLELFQRGVHDDFLGLSFEHPQHRDGQVDGEVVGHLCLITNRLVTDRLISDRSQEVRTALRLLHLADSALPSHATGVVQDATVAKKFFTTVGNNCNNGETRAAILASSDKGVSWSPVLIAVVLMVASIFSPRSHLTTPRGQMQ